MRQGAGLLGKDGGSLDKGSDQRPVNVTLPPKPEHSHAPFNGTDGLKPNCTRNGTEPAHNGTRMPEVTRMPEQRGGPRGGRGLLGKDGGRGGADAARTVRP